MRNSKSQYSVTLFTTQYARRTDSCDRVVSSTRVLIQLFLGHGGVVRIEWTFRQGLSFFHLLHHPLFCSNCQSWVASAV